MEIEIVIPAIAGNPTDLYLAQWLASVGDDVQAGEPVLLVEADKAQVEISSPASGRLARIDAESDEALVVGQVVALIECP